jgi:hypothetical protein
MWQVRYASRDCAKDKLQSPDLEEVMQADIGVEQLGLL